MPKCVLVTGAAGFIGYHLSKRLLEDGYRVIGFDNMNAYYDVGLKKARLKSLRDLDLDFSFQEMDLVDREALNALFEREKPEIVYHLAAQAGVRYSIDNPDEYTQSNLVGFGNILECVRTHRPDHVLFASSSSVYGGNVKLPFDENDNVDHPVSLYAATKKANELSAHSYSHLYGLPITGLRFFTVYGPWGRPDMALWKFLQAIRAGKKIDVYNDGDMYRDFTYVDDVVESLVRLMNKAPKADQDYDKMSAPAASSWAPYRILNIGRSGRELLLHVIEVLEKAAGQAVEKNFLPMQPGDVYATEADTSRLEALTDFRPQTSIEQGIQAFVDWYDAFHSDP